MKVDLRSDTLTLPGPGMKDAMMSAKVGDDVFGEDPSVNALEDLARNIFKMEAALFCPSGTMSNQIAIRCHTQPGDEVICEKQAHVYIYEGGGIAFNSGAQARTIIGDRGLINAEQIENEINPDDVHRPRTSLVCLENTSNRGGGSCYDLEECKKIKLLCSQKNLKLHMDGARLYNALVANNELPDQYGEIFDSISVCLNKGLGCPIGSILIGGKDYIKNARRVRKVLGGGMRQAGFMAAAGIYALQNNVKRLAEDHLAAKKIAIALEDKPFVKCMLPVETNIIIFEVTGKYTSKSLAAYLKEKDILTIAISSTQIRMVTHLGLSENMIDHAVQVIRNL
ncbi:MAG: threonine aldolase family protein [Chitinophagales bacterium]